MSPVQATASAGSSRSDPTLDTGYGSRPALEKSRLQCNPGYTTMPSMHRWVLLAYRLPREPSRPRIALWRSLRRLGAAQIGDGFVTLPLTAETHEQIEWLASDIEDARGEASVWLGEAATKAQEERWIERFRTASTDEYDTLAERATKAAGEDEASRRRSLRLLRAELRRVRARDYFGVTAGARAATAIERLAPAGEEITR